MRGDTERLWVSVAWLMHWPLRRSGVVTDGLEHSTVLPFRLRWAVARSRGRGLLLFGMLLSSLSKPATAHAQEVTPCAWASSDSGPAVVVAGPDAPFSPTIEFDFAVAENFIAVTDGVAPGRLFVFSRSGEFVSEIRRTGEGPGEFRAHPIPLAMGGDTLLAVDRVSGRWAKLLLPTGVLVASGSVLGMVMEIAPWQQEWVFTGPRREGEGTTVLHGIAPDGSVRSLASSVSQEEASGSVSWLVGSQDGRMVWGPANVWRLRTGSPGAAWELLGAQADFQTGSIREGAGAGGQRPAQLLGVVPLAADQLLSAVAFPVESAAERSGTRSWIGSEESPAAAAITTRLQWLEAGENGAECSLWFRGVARISRDGEWLAHLAMDGVFPVLNLYRLLGGSPRGGGR